METPLLKTSFYNTFTVFVLFVCFTSNLLFAQVEQNNQMNRSVLLSNDQKCMSRSVSQLEFIENKGQIADQNGNVNWDVLFIAQVENGTITIRKDGISFTFVKYDKVPTQTKETEDLPLAEHSKFREPKLVNVEMYRVDMKLNNAKMPTRITKKEMTDDYNNYYLAHCPDGVTFVRKYRTVVLENVYQNIDLVLYSNQENKFQYDFVVKPGANPNQINFRFDGAEDVQISESGELIVKTPFGNIEQKAPVAYQPNDLKNYTNSRTLTKGIQTIEGKFQKNWDNSISFVVESYNPQKALIIDPPTRLWGTYYGGSNDDYGNSVAVDGNGNVYLAGETNSTNAIATSGAHQSSKGSTDNYYDAFLVKFNSSGVRQWGTYYGGSYNDYGRSVAVDANGYVYLAGETWSSTAIATTGAHQTSYNSWGDAFLAKFNSDGVRQWGTYYGGDEIDKGYSVATDASGYVYLVGSTTSDNAIATTGAHQTTNGGSYDAFLVKFNSNGVRQWGTYYGGSSSDDCYSVAVDGSGNVYLGGETESTNAIATTGSHQSSYGGGAGDAFLVKFNSSGVRQWGTYYGGVSTDYAYSVAIDASGNVYIVGVTSSSNNNYVIATSGAFKENISNIYSDAFLVKFNSSGQRQWGTYYGGTNYDGGHAVLVDAGFVYFAGYSSSSNTNNAIATEGSYQTENYNSGFNDAILVKFNSDGTRQWGTYYGSGDGDKGYTIAKYGSALYLAGYTYYSTMSNTVLATSGSHQTSNGGYYDGFLVKFLDCNVIQAWGDDSVCVGDEFQLFASDGWETYSWSGPNGFTSSLQNPVVLADFEEGTYTFVVYGSNSDGCESYTMVEVEIISSPVVTINTNSGSFIEVICEGSSYQFDVTSDAVYHYWVGPNGFESEDKEPILTNVDESNSGEYELTAMNEAGCITKEVLYLYISPLPESEPTSNSPLCEGEDLYLYPNDGYLRVGSDEKGAEEIPLNGYNYHWTGPNGFESDDMFPIIEEVTKENEGRYYLTVSNPYGCSTTNYVDVTINEIPTFEIATNSPVCSGETIILNAIGNENYIYNWSGPNGWTAQGRNISIANATTWHSGTYTCVAINQGCTFERFVQVTVNPKPNVTASSNSPICQGSTLNLYAEGPVGASYSWSGPNGFTSSLQNPVINDAQTSNSGQYTVTCTYLGCSSTATVNVTINAKPNVSAGYNSPVYEGETIQFDATPGMASYQWTGPNGFSSNLRNPSITNANLGHSGIYTLVVTNSAGCSATVTVEVEVLEEGFDIELTISPEFQRVPYGSDLQPAFTPSVSNTRYTYRWYFDEDDTPESGNETEVARTINLNLLNITFEEEGYYYLKVSYGNQFVLSNVVRLIVTAKQPENNYIINRTRNTITIDWEYPEEGQGEGVIVVVAKQNEYNNNIRPRDGTVYTANSSFGDNNCTIGNRQYVVYYSSGNRVQVTNLMRGTYYRFRWYSYTEGRFFNPTYNLDESQNNPRSVNTMYRESEDATYVVGTKMSLSSVYPNPVEDGQIQFDLLLEQATQVEVRVYTSIGETVYTKVFDIQDGESTIVIDLFKRVELSNGVYILQVSNGEEVLQQQFVIKRQE